MKAETNIKINIKRAILIILLILTFFQIFRFSNQNGEKSSGISRKITTAVTKNVKKIQELDKNKQEEVLGTIEKVIRKLAHFSIYMVVGILMMLLMNTYEIKKLDRIAISLITGIIYASSDEIHQLFIPGRSAMITDVMIDTLGVLVGCFWVFLGTVLKNTLKQSKSI